MNMRLLLACFVFALLCATTIFAAPYAAIVINADTGEVLHKEKADTRLHTAGLTKRITLYAAFDAIETGMVEFDESVESFLKVQHEPPVKLAYSPQNILIHKWPFPRGALVLGAINKLWISLDNGVTMRKLVTVVLVISATSALGLDPQPIPKSGSCLSGYSTIGSYCNPNSNARFAVPKVGTCPSGHSTGGSACLANRGARYAILKSG